MKARPVESFATERLRAERLTSAHAGYLTALDRDPDVMAWLGGVRTPAESAEWLRHNLAHWDTNGFGAWMLRDGTGELVGRVALRWIDPSVAEEIVEVGYALQRSAWGAGLATEAARGAIVVAREQYGMPQLGAIALDHNRASNRVIEKCGFRFERLVDHPAGVHRFYRLGL